MLGERVVDGIESGEGEAPGLGLLPVETVFGEEKLLGRSAGRAPIFGNAEVSGYEIRHGRIRRRGGEPLFVGDGFEEGCRVGGVFGTSWHGVMESDGFRREFLSRVAERRGLEWMPGEVAFAAAREARLEKLGDLISENVDREALLRLIEGGAPAGLPVVAGRLVGLSAGQQAVIADNSGEKVLPSANGETSPNIPPAFVVPGGGAQRSNS